MNKTPSSKRLIYSNLTLADIELFIELAQDGHVRQFLMEEQEISGEECAGIVEAGLLLHARTGLGLYLISKDGEVIGYCGFMETHTPSNDLDIVYAFPKKFTGKGYATEACQALLNLVSSSKFAGGITAVANPKNGASIAVLEKCGFKSEGPCIGELEHLLRYRFSKARP